MAPPKADNLITQLFAKVEEGNLDAHWCMETIQTFMANMEATVKGVMKDHDEMQKWLWRPVVEEKSTRDDGRDQDVPVEGGLVHCESTRG